jgi:hypothetical protein
VISGIIQPTGNNQIDNRVIINEPTGNSLFHKAGRYDQMVVAALSADYVATVQQEITGLYGNNIGVITLLIQPRYHGLTSCYQCQWLALEICSTSHHDSLLY